MYSRSHCLARMPKDAEARLRTRLMKKRQLIQRIARDGADVGESGETRYEMVELIGMGIDDVVGV